MDLSLISPSSAVPPRSQVQLRDLQFERQQHQRETQSLPGADSGHNRECGQINPDEVHFARNLTTIVQRNLHTAFAVTLSEVNLLGPLRIQRHFRVCHFLYPENRAAITCVNTHHAHIMWFQRKAEDRAEVDLRYKKQTRTKF